jgi:hypothetical protein
MLSNGASKLGHESNQALFGARAQPPQLLRYIPGTRAKIHQRLCAGCPVPNIGPESWCLSVQQERNQYLWFALLAWLCFLPSLLPWFGDQLWLCGLIPHSALGVREYYGKVKKNCNISNCNGHLPPRSMGLLGMARANTAVCVSPKTFLLLLLLLLLLLCFVLLFLGVNVGVITTTDSQATSSRYSSQELNENSAKWTATGLPNNAGHAAMLVDCQYRCVPGYSKAVQSTVSIQLQLHKMTLQTF